MGIFATKFLLEAGEGDVNIPLDPDKDSFHSIDPLEDHKGEAAGELDPDPVIGVEEAYNIMYEGEQFYNELMESVGLHELKGYAETGSVNIVYEAADLKGFFERAKNMFKEIIKRIAAVVKRWLVGLSSIFRTDKSFYNTYKDDIAAGLKKAKSDSNFELKMKGYTFTNVSNWSASAAWKAIKGDDIDKLSDLASAIAASDRADTNEIRKIDEIRGNYHDLSDSSRGDLLGKKSVSASDFASEIFKYFRNDTAEKSDLTTKDFDESMFKTWLGDNGYREMVKNAKKNYKDLETHVNDILRKVGAIETKMKGQKTEENGDAMGRKISAVQLMVRSGKDQLNMVNTVYHGHLAAMRSQHSQIKAAAVKFVALTKKYQKPEAKSQNASAIMYGVDLI